MASFLEEFFSTVAAETVFCLIFALLGLAIARLLRSKRLLAQRKDVTSSKEVIEERPSNGLEIEVILTKPEFDGYAGKDEFSENIGKKLDEQIGQLVGAVGCKRKEIKRAFCKKYPYLEGMKPSERWMTMDGTNLGSDPGYDEVEELGESLFPLTCILNWPDSVKEGSKDAPAGIRQTESIASGSFVTAIQENILSSFAPFLKVATVAKAAVITTLCRRTESIASGSFLTSIPEEILSSLVPFLEVSTVAQMSRASQGVYTDFWCARRVWSELAIVRGCESCLPPLSAAAGVAAEHFRQHVFGISVQHLREFRSQVRNGMIPAVRVLDEAAQMLLGIMPRDGAASLSCILESATDAIWFHETWSDASVRAVEKFLEVARRRSDIVSPGQLENLEDSLFTVRNF